MSDRIRLDAIVFDAGTQIRAAIDQQVVGDYAEAMTDGARFPPIVLFHDGNRHYLADGFHRFMAAQRIQLREIDATVNPGTKEDALWFALGANKANGKRLSDADKKHAIKVAIKAWPERPAGEIASQIGCSRSWVSEVRSVQDSATGNVTRVTGKDGKSYPAARSAKAPSKNKSPKVAQQRYDRIRELAAEGHNVDQIAEELGYTRSTVQNIVAEHKIDMPATRVMGRLHRHDANRIISQMARDAEHLTADVNLIDFSAIDRRLFHEWLLTFKAAHKSLGSFIKRLEQESKKDVEAA